MAQAQPEEKLQENNREKAYKKDEKKEISNSNSFQFNAHAPEFVPSSHTQIPVSGYFYPCFNYVGLGMGPNDSVGPVDWVYVAGGGVGVGGDQDHQVQFFSNPEVVTPTYSRNVLTDDLQQKIIKQVEYQFSGLSLLANESLVKHISKDPEGYVPISVIASMKKIKSCITNNHLLSQALCSSSKLVVSNDGKKVRRKYPFTEKDKEELQSRTVVAENLPEDHSHLNLEKIFNVVRSVKAIRICHPQEPNSSRSRGDYVFSNKLHALVEYETADMAEKAVEKLNDERNWRKGLRVRLMLRRSPKSVLKTKKSEFDGLLEDEIDEAYDLPEESSPISVLEPSVENNGEEGSKKGWARGRGKTKIRTSSHNGRGVLSQSPQSSGSTLHSETSSSSPKSSPKGPRMPDGTRGFTMGRGKPMSPALTTTP
ncbi:la-related protein 6C [Rutidosis leptorrhynchoides]|uniref:la-related protein 6C n=1 Tax=Rutidosis leptorrhynchoides TaxID=125765 RepID=UPI003A9A3EC7